MVLLQEKVFKGLPIKKQGDEEDKGKSTLPITHYPMTTKQKLLS
ncbi:hypothetical protein FDUTEX481_09270 [Tolypothrix sp. PCC 7601]|nr:hypothetical protein FDUTEX481_09270 [Tolypothrix sp. PCC 7601]